MMITISELLKDHKLEDQSEKVQYNLSVLCDRINCIRKVYNSPMIVTSGLRTMGDHLRIYASKGIIDESKIPMKSLHLIGSACDVSDPDGKLKTFINENKHLLEDNHLWCEAFEYTPTWVHFQISPPKSGSRFFKP